MIRRYLDRMMRPRDLVLQFHRAGDPADPTDVTGVLTTSQALRPGDLERVRALDARNLIDGQVVKIPRSG